jgi:hypothetical protein
MRGLQGVPAAVCISRLSCRKAGKARIIHASSGVIRGIPVKLAGRTNNRHAHLACVIQSVGGEHAEHTFQAER